jgi:hypothetical protein
VSLEEALAKVDLKHPIHEAILVGITDDRAKDSFEEVPNGDGYYQVLVGFDSSIGLGAENDRQLKFALFQQLSKAILACPFSAPDRESVKAALDAWAGGNL